MQCPQQRFSPPRSAEHLSDVALLQKEGSTLFWCVPVVEADGGSSGAMAAMALAGGPLPAPAAVGALLLCYRRPEDVSKPELKAALLAAQHCAEPLAVHVRRLASSLAPSAHSRWGPFSSTSPSHDGASGTPSESGCDESCDASSSGGDDWAPDDHGASGHWGGVAAPPAYLAALDQQCAALWQGMNPWTLTFADQKVEAAFTHWRGGLLAAVDAPALLALLAFHSSAYLLAPGLRANSPLPPAAMLPSAVLLLPLLLLLAGPRSQTW